MLIGEVARRSGVSARMLRHYESLGLVRPTGRSAGGYREYSGEDIRRIFHVESLRSLGLSLREVGRALDDPGFAPAQLVAELVRHTEQRLAAEQELLARLRRIGAADPADWEQVLGIVALVAALGSESAGRRQGAALSSAATVPVESLVEAVLGETDPNVAGALHWSLARSGDEAVALLAAGLDSPTAEVRLRAVRALSEIAGAASTAHLHSALAHTDPVIRGRAALELGNRGAAEAVPTLIDMIVDETRDADAADALTALAGDPGSAERIAAGLVARLVPGAAGSAARRRLAQALAEIPGPTADRALTELARDDDRAVALTASYILTVRATAPDRGA